MFACLRIFGVVLHDKSSTRGEIRQPGAGTRREEVVSFARVGTGRVGRGGSSGSGQRLVDVGRQGFIGRLELVPPRIGVAVLTPGEVGGEILNMDLDPRPIGGE